MNQSSWGCGLPTFVGGQQLGEAEVLAAVGLHVVFLQSPLDHVGCVVLAGQLRGGHDVNLTVLIARLHALVLVNDEESIA